MSRPRHAVAELQSHGGRPGVGSVVGGEGVVLGGRRVVVVVAVPSTHQTARPHSVHQGVALGELFVHPAAPVVVGRAVAVVTLRFLPDTAEHQLTTFRLPNQALLPEDDRLLADVEVVLTELVLHDDWNARRQSFSPIHVQLPCLSLPRTVNSITVNTDNKHKLTCAEYRQSEQPGGACRR